MTRGFVLVLILIITVAILGWDAWLYMDDHEGNTITQIVRWLSTISALVPWSVGFLFGFLTSHFFEGIGKRVNKAAGFKLFTVRR